MSNNDTKKDLAKYTQTKPEQLHLFELLDPSLQDYSNSIELYDTMPKYHIGGVERIIDKTGEFLPVLQRDFVHRGKPYKLDILPASIIDKKTGKTINYYPSQREELVEDALRKIATKGRVMKFDEKVGVKFTYYEVQQELKKMGHGYSITEIKLAVEILGKAGIEITSKDDEVSITSNFFTYIGKETQEMAGKERVVVMFHSLVTKSINRGDYRLFNYDKLMTMKMPLARWLHKRISHMFLQATINNPYEIKLSTIVRDSGMKNYKTISERSRQVEKALDELNKEEINILTKWEKSPEISKNKILDIKYSLFMSEEFVSDAKKANKLANLRLGSSEEEKTYNIDELRQEIEKPIYGLTKSVINGYINKINNRGDYDKIEQALEAALEYMEKKKSRNEEVNPAATTKAAISQAWVPTKKSGGKATQGQVVVSKISEEEKRSLEKAREKKLDNLKQLQNDPTWIEIQNKLKDGFGLEIWEKWFSTLQVVAISETKLILTAVDKFQRDWIIREFLTKKTGNMNQEPKNLLNLVSEILPNVKEVLVLAGSLDAFPQR